MNRNVFLNILLAGTSGVADSVWSGTVFVAFLYTLTNDSNSKVGYVEAMQGASQLASALPVGYLADKYSRSGVIKVGAVTQLIFILAMFAATLGDGRLSIDMQVPSITRP